MVDPAAKRSRISVIAYCAEFSERIEIDDVAALPEIMKRHRVTWINVDGLGDAGVLAALGKLFHLHPLALEDVVHVHQRPKVEQYPDNVFIVLRMIHRGDTLASEQLSIFLGSNYVLTFQEDLPGDCFDAVRERIGGEKNGFSGHGADYLAYRLIDAVIDNYFPVLEHYGETIDDLEEEMLTFKNKVDLNTIHAVKQDMLQLRRSIWPTREVVNALLRDSNTAFGEETRVYLRDCYDHTVQLLDLLEMYRELSADLRDLYLSSMSHRMNEIMKVLTIISTLFIPLTFVAGIYGMNFDTKVSPWNMPELEWYYGYPFAWGLMALITIGMLIFFVRKRWIGERWRK
ncbi:MAG: magnesium/cobalt transporter CorA [Pirellulales bacterium]